MSAAGHCVASSRTGQLVRARSCSIEALPHTPHDDDVKKLRAISSDGGATPGASVTSMTLYVFSSKPLSPETTAPSQ